MKPFISITFQIEINYLQYCSFMFMSCYS